MAKESDECAHSNLGLRVVHETRDLIEDLALLDGAERTNGPRLGLGIRFALQPSPDRCSEGIGRALREAAKNITAHRSGLVVEQRDERSIELGM